MFLFRKLPFLLFGVVILFLVAMLDIAGAPFKLVFEPKINVLEATVAMSSAQVFILSLQNKNEYYKISD